MKFNALVERTGSERALLLKWHVRGDEGVANEGDRVLVGFFDPATTVATIFMITRATTTTVVAGTVASGAMTLIAYTRTGTGGPWSSLEPIPSSLLSSARIDTVCDGAVPPICEAWAVRLRVPGSVESGGLPLPDVFQLWSEVYVDHFTTADQMKFPAGAATGDNTAVPPSFPEPLGSAQPNSAPWNRMRLGGIGPCRTAVELRESDIEVSNALGSSAQIDVDGLNTFHVRARNNSPYTFSPSSIQARLRTSDWSSQACDDAAWTTVPSADASCATATGTAGVLPLITPGGVFDLFCSWTLTPGQRCAYRPDLASGCAPDPRPLHSTQAIAVDLYQSSGTWASFLPDGAWRLFEFAASADD